MKFLILAHRSDVTAARVAQLLAVRHGSREVRFLPADELTGGVSWAHRLEDARISTTLTFSDGSRLSTDMPVSILNRLHSVQAPRWEAGPPADRAYAVTEMHAFLLSWLSSQGGSVVNVPSSKALSGPGLTCAEWLHLAGIARIPTVSVRVTSNARRFPQAGRTVHPVAAPDWPPHLLAPPLPTALPTGEAPVLLVEPVKNARQALIVGDRVLGGLPEGWLKPCLRLSQLSGCPLLELTFARLVASHDEDWRLVSVDPFPETAHPDDLTAIADLLQNTRARGARS